jgi:hypothetical protein
LSSARKKQRPAEAGRDWPTASAAGWLWQKLVLRLFPSDPRDVATGDADIGQLAVTEMRKLVHGNAIALPGLEEVDYGQQHILVPLFGFPATAQRSAPESELNIGTHGALQNILVAAQLRD